jgi:predicted acetyltransferase
MNVHLEIIGIEKKDTLKHLLEFYIYEFTKYMDSIKIREDGTYGYGALDDFFEDEKYTCYLIRQDEQLAGFAIVEKFPEHFYMREFFVLKKGNGIGKLAAKQVFDRHKGKWIITQIKNNYPAQAFWRSVIREYTNDHYEEYYSKERKSIQTFNNQ